MHALMSLMHVVDDDVLDACCCLSLPSLTLTTTTPHRHVVLQRSSHKLAHVLVEPYCIDSEGTEEPVSSMEELFDEVCTKRIYTLSPPSPPTTTTITTTTTNHHHHHHQPPPPTTNHNYHHQPPSSSIKIGLGGPGRRASGGLHIATTRHS